MRKGCWIIVLALMLSGCGFRFLYNNLDWLVVEYLDDYVELDHDQEQWLAGKVMLLSEWHRQHEIPNYVDHLDQLIKLDLSTFTARDLAEQKQQFKQHGERLVTEIEPQLILLVSQLDNEQADDLMHNLRLRHGKYQEKYQSYEEAELREHYAERIADNVAQWFGSLTDGQEQLIAQWTGEMDITFNDWVHYQTILRLEVKQMLAQRDNQQILTKTLKQILTEPQSYYSHELARKVEHNRKLMDIYLVRVVNSATPTQSDHYREQLQDWKGVALDIMD
ncbi:DUF6279 family lipoprotein [Vibrio sp. FNV 38]|nr:DUF6279 family lipoprotein [Vibrio sp. FNV 38]